MRYLVLALVFSVSVIGQAAASKHHGGGSIFRLPGETRLIAIDFFELLADSPETSFPDTVENYQVEPSLASMRIGFDQFPEIRKSKVYAEALERVRRWEEVSVTAAVVRHALENLNWYYTPYSTPAYGSGARSLFIKAEDAIFMPEVYEWIDPLVLESIAEKFPGVEVAPVVRYVPGQGAAIILEIWNQLDAFQQEAVLVHEAIRHIQQTYAARSKLSHNSIIREADVLSLTSILMTEEPGEQRETLDDVSLWGAWTKNYMETLPNESYSQICRQVRELIDEFKSPKTRHEASIQNLVVQVQELQTDICELSSHELEYYSNVQRRIRFEILKYLFEVHRGLSGGFALVVPSNDMSRAFTLQPLHAFFDYANGYKSQEAKSGEQLQNDEKVFAQLTALMSRSIRSQLQEGRLYSIYEFPRP